MARPSKRTSRVEDEICRRLSEGETLRAICRDEEMPPWRSVYDWISQDEGFAARFARAREVGADAIAEETLDIIDELPGRTNTEHGDKVDSGYVAWQKNRAEQRLKLLAKWFPKKYGDKAALELTGADGGPVQITDTERAAKIAAILAAAKARRDGDTDDVTDLL